MTQQRVYSFQDRTYLLGKEVQMYGFNVIIEGDYACFTRPEFKVERLSYDVPTPGSIEGMLKSIYWKPAIRYVVDKIVVFKPVRFETFTRNEVSSKLSWAAVKARMEEETPEKDICIYTNEVRSQRSSTVLKDVRYGISFHFELTGIRSEEEADQGEEKHYNIIRRRLLNGQFFSGPYLGCREFAVKRIDMVSSFNLEEISEDVRRMGDVDLGYMLYGMSFRDGGIPINGDFDNPVYSNEADPIFYRPHMIEGIIDVAEYRRTRRC